jgi:hypothetical protein
VDKLATTLRDNTATTPEVFHATIFDFVAALQKIPAEMVEYEPLRDVFDEIIAQEIVDLSNQEKVRTMARQAYQMQLPFDNFW